MNFVKYEGAGNDFIIVNHWDQRELTDTSAAHIARLCDRHFGIGADGLMIVERDTEYDFFMRYFKKLEMNSLGLGLETKNARSTALPMTCRSG